MEEMVEGMGSRVNMLKINGKNQERLTRKHKVTKFPSLILFPHTDRKTTVMYEGE